MTLPVKLIPDEWCRVCYHAHTETPCLQIAHAPGPDDTDVESVCMCDEYVDLEAQSKIIVRTTKLEQS